MRIILTRCISPFERIDDACKWFDSLKPGPQLSGEDIENIGRGTAVKVCKIKGLAG
jgi:hypothetical protein